MSRQKVIIRRISKVVVVVRDVTINNIITEGSKLTPKEYKTQHDFVRKVIHEEPCKRLKFDHTTK